MEYKEIENLLKENIQVRELINLKCYALAFDTLNEQYERLYNSIDLKELTLSNIEKLDGI